MKKMKWNLSLNWQMLTAVILPSVLCIVSELPHLNRIECCIEVLEVASIFTPYQLSETFFLYWNYCFSPIRYSEVHLMIILKTLRSITKEILLLFVSVKLAGEYTYIYTLVTWDKWYSRPKDKAASSEKTSSTEIFLDCYLHLIGFVKRFQQLHLIGVNNL